MLAIVVLLLYPAFGAAFAAFTQSSYFFYDDFDDTWSLGREGGSHGGEEQRPRWAVGGAVVGLILGVLALTIDDLDPAWAWVLAPLLIAPAAVVAGKRRYYRSERPSQVGVGFSFAPSQSATPDKPLTDHPILGTVNLSFEPTVLS